MREKCDQCGRLLSAQQSEKWRKKAAKKVYMKPRKYCGNDCKYASMRSPENLRASK